MTLTNNKFTITIQYLHPIVLVPLYFFIVKKKKVTNTDTKRKKPQTITLYTAVNTQ